MSLAYDKFFSAVEKHYAQEERDFQRRMQQLQIKCPTIESLGGDPVYKNFKVTDKMRSQMRELVARRSGLDKVIAMKDILNEINDELSRSVTTKSELFDNGSKASILPDDLGKISLCVCKHFYGVNQLFIVYV